MIESILICALFVYGVKAVINGYAGFFDWDLEDFYEYRKGFHFDYTLNMKVRNHRPKWQQFILKPTIYCNVCMSSFWGSVYCYVCLSSFWGSVYYWATSYDADYWFIFWLLHVFCSAAIITLFNKIPE